MKKYNKVIFVCNGNTCRSPMAATIFSSVKNDDKLLVASRGMVVLFDEPYNPKAVAVCAAHDMIMPNNPATQISADDFGNDTLVLTMSDAQKNKIYAEFDNAINVYTLAEYAGRPEDYEVMDPCGKGIDEYKKCFDGLYELVTGAVAKMN
ncbi:putative uncharacterized protein [Bacteroides pectinophilus CAG:437]|uniref:Phosphotyrosine protein phosphatase I domain-containing protein n=1 Tax=Bacteroides pectinophilus CAG:437 TaxID=1263051 RepID=R7ANH8_9FIRM|nr:putative uncharacterized protein [Bacteroides pectinophilus CAG:437]